MTKSIFNQGFAAERKSWAEDPLAGANLNLYQIPLRFLKIYIKYYERIKKFDFFLLFQR